MVRGRALNRRFLSSMNCVVEYLKFINKQTFMFKNFVIIKFMLVIFLEKEDINDPNWTVLTVNN